MDSEEEVTRDSWGGMQQIVSGRWTGGIRDSSYIPRCIWGYVLGEIRGCFESKQISTAFMKKVLKFYWTRSVCELSTEPNLKYILKFSLNISVVYGCWWYHRLGISIVYVYVCYGQDEYLLLYHFLNNLHCSHFELSVLIQILFRLPHDSFV